jgi:hypothetical protein
MKEFEEFEELQEFRMPLSQHPTKLTYGTIILISLAISPPTSP